MRELVNDECQAVAAGIAPAVVPIFTTAITWAGRAAVTAIAGNTAKEIYGARESQKSKEEIQSKERDNGNQGKRGNTASGGFDFEQLLIPTDRLKGEFF